MVTVAMSKVCRLHQEERCRFGRDCKNFHLCRDVYARLQLAHINIKAAPPIPETAPCKPLTVDLPQAVAPISLQPLASPAVSTASSASQPSTPARGSTPPPMALQRWPLGFSFSRDCSLSGSWESEWSESPGPSGSPSPTSSPLRDGRLPAQTLQALESFRSEFSTAPAV
jgi:hypothetical protein